MSGLFNTTNSKEWMEGYPIGNGRLAAMVWGKQCEDILTLNDEWLWRGTRRGKECEAAAHDLPRVRELFLKGDLRGGTAEAVKCFGSERTNVVLDDYQVAGDLVFVHSNPGEFVSRELDIQNGIAKVKRGSVTLLTYTDCVKDVLISTWTSNEKFDGKLIIRRCKDEDATQKCLYQDGDIIYICQFNGGLMFGIRARYFTDGTLSIQDSGISVSGATYLNVITDICVDKDSSGCLFEPKDYDFESDIKAHMSKFSEYMNRVSFDIDGSLASDELSVSERIDLVRKGEEDIGLAKLYFDYGRYLMVSCSILADLPANLQGKWNDSLTPPWHSDYHFDINLQMNYWMCEAVGFEDFTLPMINYLMCLLENGKKAAKNHYGCRGTLFPLSDDAWGESLPVSGEYGIWIGGAPWMAQHLWWHYTYSGDKEYLKTKAYPFFKAVAQFYEDYLIKDENGTYQIIPSQSPENSYAGVTDFDVSLCISSAMDVQLAYDALGYAIDSAAILGLDSEQSLIWQHLRSNLPEFKIGNDGRLLEWNEEKEEVEPGHRHLSHLYGIYPSDIFMSDDKKAQYDAAKKSLDFRLSCGGGHTGWSRAWVSCMYARFGDGEKFLEHLIGLAKDFATDSLLDLHPPRIFQIDGNFGAVAAITEALVSYRAGKVHLLHALPKQWQKGSICGIRVPGGHTISVWWEKGKLKKADVTFGFENEITVVIDGKEKTYKEKNGESITIFRRL